MGLGFSLVSPGWKITIICSILYCLFLDFGCLKLSFHFHFYIYFFPLLNLLNLSHFLFSWDYCDVIISVIHHDIISLN